MSTIKSIETRYRGCRFRSRLEARWAVFFDALGLAWEYEPQGYLLPNGTPYLPDFAVRLPAPLAALRPDNIGAWTLLLEIKPSSYQPDAAWPSHPALDVEDAAWGPGVGFVLLRGEPWHGAYEGFVWGDSDYRWCECANCGALGIQFSGAANRNCNCVSVRGGDSGHDMPWPNRGNSDESPRLMAAYAAARGARFEFGEQG